MPLQFRHEAQDKIELHPKGALLLHKPPNGLQPHPPKKEQQIAMNTNHGDSPSTVNMEKRDSVDTDQMAATGRSLSRASTQDVSLTVPNDGIAQQSSLGAKPDVFFSNPIAKSPSPGVSPAPSGVPTEDDVPAGTGRTTEAEADDALPETGERAGTSHRDGSAHNTPLASQQSEANGEGGIAESMPLATACDGEEQRMDSIAADPVLPGPIIRGKYAKTNSRNSVSSQPSPISRFKDVILNPLSRSLSPAARALSATWGSPFAAGFSKTGNRVTWRNILESQQSTGNTLRLQDGITLPRVGESSGGMSEEEAERIKDMVVTYGTQLCDQIKETTDRSKNYPVQARGLGRFAVKVKILLEEIRACSSSAFTERSLDGLGALQYTLETFYEVVTGMDTMGSLHAILMVEQIAGKIQTATRMLEHSLLGLNAKDLPVPEDVKQLVKFLYKQVKSTSYAPSQDQHKIAAEFRRRVVWMKRNDAELVDIRNTLSILITTLERKKHIFTNSDKLVEITRDLEGFRKEVPIAQATGNEDEVFFLNQVIAVLESFQDEADIEMGEGVDPLSLPPEKRRRRYVTPIIAFLTMLLSFVVVGLWGGRIVLATLDDGNWFRMLHIAAFPVFIFFMMFSVQVLVSSLCFTLGPVAHTERNSYYYSNEKPTLQKPKQLPKVTIQMPVYKEDLDFVIKPSLESLQAACDYYRRKGGRYNIFVNDDGLQLLSESERNAREAFYRSRNIGYIARPGHGKDGFLRRGRFKKASNMNFCLNISERVRKLVEEGNMDQNEALEKIKAEDKIFIGGGDVSIGDFVLLVDSDTRVPEDCITPTVLELLTSPKVAFTQHMTMPMQVVHDYWEDAIAHFTTSIYTIAIRLACSAGDVAPLVGHNAFLRWSAIKEVAFKDPEDEGRRKYWSENHVSEDFDMALRFQVHGYYGRYIAYTGFGFLEGVSLTVHDEIIRFRKYAFGASELLFNPIPTWPTKGPFSKVYRRYLFSRTPWYSKVVITSYLGTYFAISFAWEGAVLNFFLFQYSEYWRKEVVHSMDITYTVILIFAIIGPTGFAILRYRLNMSSIWRALILEFRHVLVFSTLFTGLSYHVWTAITSHLLGIEVNFGITSKEIRKTNFFKEIVYTISIYRQCYIFNLLLTGMMVAFCFFVPDKWRITDTRAWVPLLITIVGHMLAPILLNPVLMRVKF